MRKFHAFVPYENSQSLSKTTKRRISICGIFADVCLIKIQLGKIVVTFPSPLNPSINHFLLVISLIILLFTTGSGKCVYETEK